MVPSSEKEPEGWGSTDKFTVVLETAGLNATELSVYCRQRGLYPRAAESVIKLWDQGLLRLPAPVST